MELDRYRVYLQGHLIDHQFPERDNPGFIEARTEAAWETFTSMRLQGHSVVMAEEAAMRTLLAGLYVSRYDIVYNIFEEELWTQYPPDFWPAMTDHMLMQPEVNEILDRYKLDGDFLSRETHQPMLDELLGAITEILEGYGL